jgi:hypothetical protein
VYENSENVIKYWDIPHAVIKTQSGGSAVAGKTFLLNGSMGGWAMKLDSYGRTLWQKAFALDGDDVELHCILETHDGSMVVFGIIVYYCGFITPCEDYLAVRMDKDGNIKWNQLAEKSYLVPAKQNLQINGIFHDMGIGGSFNAAYATVTVESAGKVFAYASVIDNRTGDAIYVPFNKSLSRKKIFE